MSQPEIFEFDKQYINGQWVPSTNAGKMIEVTDANTAKVCGRCPDGSAEDTEKAIAAARKAFETWSVTPLEERKACVTRMMENVAKREKDIAYWVCKELGCTPKAAEAIQATIFRRHSRTALQEIDNIVWSEPAGKNTVIKEPIGVVGAITPWNAPLNQIGLKVPQALLCGCTIVLKPSEVTPISAKLVADGIAESGLPPGVFNMVVGRGDICGEVMSQSKDVDMISFTGSTRAGKRIQENSTGNMKRVRTELGGKSAAVMLDDADLAKSIPTFMGQLVGNTGQACNALSRMLIPRSKYEEAVGIAKTYMEGVTVGKSDNPKARIGPLVSETQWNRVQGYLNKGIEEGARVVTGGPGKPSGLEDGYFVKPTVFADANNKMTIAQEEIFGPVLTMIPYDTEAEAIDIANDTIYGLNNAVGSSDQTRALQVAAKLKSGTVMVNNVGGDMLAPFGGRKSSGDAREWGKYGLEEYLVTKTLNVPIADVHKAFPHLKSKL